MKPRSTAVRMALRKLLLLAIPGFIALPGVAETQTLESFGSRVRIVDVNGEVHIGTLQAASNDELTILGEASGANVRVPLKDVRRMEWNDGERRRFLKYFAIGTLSVATVVGTGLALATANECQGLICSPAEAFVLGTMLGGAIGAPVGVIAGLTVREEVWLPILLPRSPGVTLSLHPSIGPHPGTLWTVSVRTR